MKFLFLIYHEEKVLDTMPPKEMQKLVDSALDYDDEIRGSGHYIVSNALQRARTARTIRVRGGKATVTDGPFAETKEQLGGFFLIDAKDMDEACAVAARFPPARIGIIERQINVEFVPLVGVMHSLDLTGFDGYDRGLGPLVIQCFARLGHFDLFKTIRYQDGHFFSR